jgi:HEAT repeat protein
LRTSGIGTDAKALLAYLKKHTGNDEDLLKVDALIRQLGSEEPDAREQASTRIVRLGPAALVKLRAAMSRRDDPERQRRAQSCIEEIERGWRPFLLSATTQQLISLKVDGTAEALLALLPYSGMDEPYQADVAYALDAFAANEAKVRSLLEDALTDPMAVRRMLAACILGYRGHENQRVKVRRLLQDQDASVRLRAAQGLLARHERSAVPVLISLLSDESVFLAWQAEELLRCVAGETAPPDVLGVGEPNSRNRCREGWEKWWGARSDSFGFEQFIRDQRRPLLFLVYYARNADLKSGSRIELFGSDGICRWSLNKLSSVVNARLLPNERILYQQGDINEQDPRTGVPRTVRMPIVTVADLKGTVLWDRRDPGAYYSPCLDVPMGFLIDEGQVTEVSLEGQPRRVMQVPGAPFTGRGRLSTALRNGVRTIAGQDQQGWWYADLNITTGNMSPATRLPLLDGRVVGLARHSDSSIALSLHRWKDRRPGMEAEETITCIFDLTGKLVRKHSGRLCPTPASLHNGNMLLVRNDTPACLSEIDPSDKVVSEYFFPCVANWNGPAVCFPLLRLGFDTLGTPSKDVNASLERRLRGLKSEYRWVRLSSAVLIGELTSHASQAIPAIIDGLNTNDEELARYLSAALRSHGVASPADVLPFGADPRPLVRERVLHVLPYLKIEAKLLLPLAAKAIKDPNNRIRRAAVFVLGGLRSEAPTVVPYLAAALRDPDAAESEGEITVAQDAAFRLRGFGRDIKPALPQLIEALTSKDPQLRRLAAGALSALGPDAAPAIPGLLVALESRDLKSLETRDMVRKAVVYTLGQIGEGAKDALPRLYPLLEDPNSELRSMVVAAIKQIKLD